jgi:ubiquinone/menaquinone biosynthesis C-methylase UbiE
MQSKSQVINCYNLTAGQYAANYFHELNHKHLDRILLGYFTNENKEKGRILDLGCGPGQTTAFVYALGVPDILGTDISPAMIEKARELNPAMKFETADMLCLQYADDQFGSAIAFYAIVHFTEDELATALKEIYRVLKPQGQFLFSFHIGNQTVHLDTFLNETVSIDFHFFEVETVVQLAISCGFKVVDTIERKPYPEVEYPSDRAYVWLEKG